GQFADINVDAPAGLQVDELRFHETELSTTARAVAISDAYVTGSLLLQTPLQTLLFENRSPVPKAGNNVQMYQPDFAFALNLDDYRTITDAFIIRYDASAEVTNDLDGLPFDGASLVRDTI